MKNYAYLISIIIMFIGIQLTGIYNDTTSWLSVVIGIQMIVNFIWTVVLLVMK